jgi:hypothetical protein
MPKVILHIRGRGYIVYCFPVDKRQNTELWCFIYKYLKSLRFTRLFELDIYVLQSYLDRI